MRREPQPAGALGEQQVDPTGRGDIRDRQRRQRTDRGRGGISRHERVRIEVRPLVRVRARLVQLREKRHRVQRLERRLGLDESSLDTRRHGDRCLATAVALLGPQFRVVVEPRDPWIVPPRPGVGDRSERKPVRPFHIRYGVALVGKVAVEDAVVLAIGVLGVLLPVHKGRGHRGRQRPGRRVGAAVEQRPGLPERRERLHVRVGGGRERRIEPRSRRVEQLVCGEGLAEVDVPVRIQVAHGNSGTPRLGEEDVRQTRQVEHLGVTGVAGRELRELRRGLLRGVTGLMHATEPEIHVRVGDLDAPRIHLDARRECLRVDPFVGQQAAVHDDTFGATRAVRVITRVRDAEVPERAGPDRGQGRRVA